MGEEAVLLDGNHGGFFLITDLIVETLSDRIKRWKTQEEEEGRVNLSVDTSSVEFQEKMKYAQDVASALKYLQEQKLVVLNLSPKNIGFLQNKTLQLFDLGHCKEMPETSNTRDDGLSDDELSQDELSVMLGVGPVVQVKNSGGNAEDEKNASTKVGGLRKVVPTAGLGVVPRYMSPEVVVNAQYSFKSDSYSFAMVLFEMLTLSKPYASYQPGQHLVKVCMEARRPNLTLYRFPKALESLIRRAWKHDWNDRVSVTTILKVLRNAKFAPPLSSAKGKLKSKPARFQDSNIDILQRQGLSPRGHRQNRLLVAIKSKSDRNIMAMVSPAARKKQTVQMRPQHDWKDMDLL